MEILFVWTIIFFIIGIILKALNQKESSNKKTEAKYNYFVLKNPMTETELKFCKELKSITDKYELIVIPQIQLQKILSTNNDIYAFNKIKAKSIDFAIVDKNYNYKMFIELDDYTHNRKNRAKRDSFINELFNRYNLKLIRIRVSNNYNKEELENRVKEVAF